MRRLAMALGAALALCASAVALAQPPGRGGYPSGHPGGHAAPPRAAPRTGSGRPPMSNAGRAPSNAWGGPPPSSGSAWNPSQHNGYWMDGRWYSGAPRGPTTYQSPGFRPGFIPWRRGAYLPPQYQAYVITNWGGFHLRRPPVGYNWVRVGNEFLLISAATGLIFDVVTAD